MPAVIEPLREQWDNVKATALAYGIVGNREAAVEAVKNFHHELCHLRILDPACGSGNFLYVTMEHMKRLEGEVLDLLRNDLDEPEATLELERFTVDPHQFLGIEINPRAATIAEVVLWIGYLQWHFRRAVGSCPPSRCSRTSVTSNAATQSSPTIARSCYGTIGAALSPVGTAIA